MAKQEGGRMQQRRHHNALRNVPWQVMADIRDRIEALPDGNEKTILRMYFVWGLTPRQIIERCEQYNIRSRNNTFYTTRSIQNICMKYFPEVRQYRKSNPQKETRKDHGRFVREFKKKCCALCGYEPEDKSELVVHHEIPANPVFIFPNGERVHGEAVPENMVTYCKPCHKRVTNYHFKMGYITTGRRMVCQFQEQKI